MVFNHTIIIIAWRDMQVILNNNSHEKGFAIHKEIRKVSLNNFSFIMKFKQKESEY